MVLYEYLSFLEVILKNIITTVTTILNMTILLAIVVVLCLQMTITVKLSFIVTWAYTRLRFTSDMEIGGGGGYNLITNRSMLMKHHPKNIKLLYIYQFYNVFLL